MKTNYKHFVFLTLVLSLSSGCAYFSGIGDHPDPLTAQEHNNLGVAYEKEGKYKLALKEYKKAAEGDENLVTPLVNMGNVYFKQEKFKKAEKYYLKALERDSRNIEAANNLGNVYLQKGEGYEKGIEYLVSSLPPPEIAPAYALDTLAMLYSASGSKDKAADLLLLACKSVENDEELKSEINNHLIEIGGRGCDKN